MKTATFKNSDDEKVTVKVGDYVCFKSDTEQTGKVTAIRSSGYGKYMLTVEDPDGFPGDYLRYATTTVVSSDRTWSE